MFPLLILAIALVISAILVTGTVKAVQSRKNYGLPHRESRKFSYPAREIIEKYRTLPVDNRPHGNIYEMMRALDVKCGVTEASHHFSDRGYEYRVYNMKFCGGRTSRYSPYCDFVPYHRVYEELEKIQTALDEQQHRLEVAAVEGGLSEVEDFTQRLREEHNLINTVTKELT